MNRLLDRNLLTALILLGISVVFAVDSSADAKDWIFPRLVNYLILGIAALLLIGVVFAAVMKAPADALEIRSEDRGVQFDVLMFLLIVLGYMLLMYGLGFWLSSFLMLAAASIYLTADRTLKNMALAILVPIAFCVIAYVVFRHIFYVPLPEARWWAGFE